MLILDAADIVRFTPGADKKDLLLVVSILPLESFMVLREAWTFCLWDAPCVGRV
jgi:hypothetical protein